MPLREQPSKSFLPRDPRYYQIAILSTLLLYGTTRLGFDVSAGRAALFLLTCLATQWACSKLWKLPRFDPRSPLISGLSLCLLLRTNHWQIAMGAAVAAIASKFVFQWKGRHVFNPTNIAIVLALLATGKMGPSDPDPGLAWIPSGQWGAEALKAFGMACLGGLVIHRSSRSDATVAFLAFYLGIVFGRAWWLGDPWRNPVHQASNGTLMIFAFFMISDPKTLPDSRLGRIAFVGLVACAAGWVQYGMFRPNGLIWSLAFLSPLSPVINWLLPGQRYEWPGQAEPQASPSAEPEPAEPALPFAAEPA
jgi:Na+-transporting NADH:ubiquinone oxidoreductase subunit NqrB